MEGCQILLRTHCAEQGLQALTERACAVVLDLGAQSWPMYKRCRPHALPTGGKPTTIFRSMRAIEMHKQDVCLDHTRPLLIG